MSEDYDYNPGAWKGHDFSSARKTYDAHAGRSYAKAQTSGVTAADMVAESLHTDSENPLVVMVDVTGSMGRWPATMFSKMPYLEIEGKEYLGDDMEISFGAIGDHKTGSKYPVQTAPFTSGLDLAKQLEWLVVEGGGGANQQESYLAGALYYASNCEMPNATRKPLFVFVADESPYDSISVADAKRVSKVDIARSMTAKQVFALLQEKFSVYLVYKSYSPASRATWASLIGEDHIADLDDADRVVDVIFGIMAKETGRVGYYRDEITGRQTAAQVDTAYRALHTIHAADPRLDLLMDGQSRMHVADDDATPSTDLI